MSLGSPRPATSQCLLVLPFLLPPRTRAFLQDMLRKRAVPKHVWSSKTIARCLSSRKPPADCSSLCPRNIRVRPRVLGCEATSLSSIRRSLPISTRSFRTTRSAGARKLKKLDDEDLGSDNEAPPGLEAPEFERIKRRVRKIYIKNSISRLNMADRILARVEEAAMHMSQQIEVLKQYSNFSSPSKDFQEDGVEQDIEFWKLWREQFPKSTITFKDSLYDLFEREAPISSSRPAKSQDEGQRNDDTVSYRAAPLDEYVVFAPEFSSKQEKEEYYGLFIEKFLPPHLQIGNTEPTPPILESSSKTPNFLDMPYPSVFASATDDVPSAKIDTTRQSFLSELEDEWNSRWTPGSYSKLLYTLEIAREDGIDVLNTLMLSRRQREVIWLAKRLVERGPNILDVDIRVWNRVSARSDRDDPKHPNMDNTMEEGFISYNKEERKDISRRRRGVGVILSSLTSMLLRGWRAETTGKQSLFDILTMIDTPPVLHNPETKDESSSLGDLFESSFSQALSASEVVKSETPGNMELASEEIFSTVAQLLAFLHAEEHVPPIVYTEKHPRLQKAHEEIMQMISTEVEVAYGRELGLNIPQPDTRNRKIDWALWIELVNSIAAERGLGVSAMWLLRSGTEEISWKEPSEIDEGTPKRPNKALLEKKVELPSYLVQQAVATCIFNGAEDAWPPETPGRMLKLLKTVANEIKPHDKLTSRVLLDHPEVNFHSSFAEKIVEVGIKDGWDLDAYYPILLGTCNRYTISGSVQVWAQIERLILGSSPILDIKEEKGQLAPLQFAPDDCFKYPTFILIRLLRQFRYRQKYALFRYIVKTTISKEQFAENPPLLNSLLNHAGDLKDNDLARELLRLLHPPLTHETLTTILRMHLKLGQQREAQAVLDFMKRSGIEPDHMDLGIVTHSTYARSSEEGNALMDKAVKRVEDMKANAAAKLREEDKHLDAKPFREGVMAPTIQEPVRDLIGSASWLAALNAAVHNNDQKRAFQALKALGLDLNDPLTPSKMGIRIFNILLAGVVQRKGSVQGMEMFKMYCLPNKTLMRMMDEARTSHRSGDINLDAGVSRSQGRNLAGVQVQNPLDSSYKILEQRSKMPEGVVVPNIITLRTIVHEALREKRDFFLTKRFLAQPIINENRAVWLRYNAHYDSSWEKVLDWAKGIWDVMQYGEEEWQELLRMNIKKVRTPHSHPKVLNKEAWRAERTRMKGLSKADVEDAAVDAFLEGGFMDDDEKLLENQKSKPIERNEIADTPVFDGEREVLDTTEEKPKTKSK